MKLDFKNGDKAIRNDGRVGKVISIFEWFERFGYYEKDSCYPYDIKIKWEDLLENGQPFDGEDSDESVTTYQFDKNEKKGYEGFIWELYSIGDYILGEKNKKIDFYFINRDIKKLLKERKQIQDKLDVLKNRKAILVEFDKKKKLKENK